MSKPVRFNFGDVRMSRVLSEDDDFLILEVGKRDDVTFHLQQNEEGETVGGDRFLSILFVRQKPDGSGIEVWDPSS